MPPAEPTSPSWTRPAARRRRRRGLGGLLTLAVAAGAIAWVLLPPAAPLAVSGARVDAAVPAGACDTTVDVVGTVSTNGRPGTVRYQWDRSDGQTTAPQSQTVTEGASEVQVHLQWSVSGRGRFPAQATLRVLDPTPAQATGAFTYSCP